MSNDAKGLAAMALEAARAQFDKSGLGSWVGSKGRMFVENAIAHAYVDGWSAGIARGNVIALDTVREVFAEKKVSS